MSYLQVALSHFTIYLYVFTLSFKYFDLNYTVVLHSVYVKCHQLRLLNA